MSAKSQPGSSVSARAEALREAVLAYRAVEAEADETRTVELWAVRWDEAMRALRRAWDNYALAVEKGLVD